MVDRQATSPRGRYLDACRARNRGGLGRDALNERTVQLAFVNVIDALHMVNGAPTPTTFFTDERRSGGGIRLTDAVLELVRGEQAVNLPVEVESRWRLVETAWELNLPRHLITVGMSPDDEPLVVGSGRTRRRPVTAVRPALNGYQDGWCFYCGRVIDVDGGAGDVDVDHFIPWSLQGTGASRNLDGVWNLVLACRDCNRGEGGKAARLPAARFLEALHGRNEYLIGSHHPLRETLILQTGATEQARAAFLRASYAEASRVLVHAWESPP